METNIKKYGVKYATQLDVTQEYDFVCLKRKIVIEFHGDIWHGNPMMFTENDTPNPYNELTSKELWNKDLIKQKAIEKMGFKYYVVWEKDYNEKPLETLNKCLDYLK